MFNLNIKGHGSCVTFVKRFGIPLLVVGGGGYTPRNVARAWAHETSICIGAQDKLDPKLPEGMPFRNAFDKEGPTLFPNLGNWKFQNANSPAYLEKILDSVRGAAAVPEGRTQRADVVHPTRYARVAGGP